jgi:retron-type reverse transcriptase
MLVALERVQQNGGAPGIDGMTVDELRAHLQSNWLRIKAALLADTYKPKPFDGSQQAE